MRPFAFVALPLCLFLASGCNSAGQADSEAPRERSIYRIPVEKYVVQPERFTQTVRATGILQAEADVDLTAEVGGTVVHVAEPIGMALAKGDLVVEIDPIDHKLALAQAEASLASTRAGYARAKDDLSKDQSLFDQGLTSEQQASSMEFAEQIQRAQILEAEAQRDLAARAVEKTRQTSPIDAELGDTFVEVGEWIPPGTKVARVVGVDTVEAVVFLSELAVAKVAVGQEAHVVADTFPGRTFVGQVHSISPTASQSTRTFATIIRVPNPEGHPLRAGMAARVEIITRVIEDAVVIPEDAIGGYNGDRYVFALVDSPEGTVVKKHHVTLGMKSGRRVQVLSGVSYQSEIVASGVDLLAENRPVDVVND